MASLYVSYYGSVSHGCGKDPIGSEVVTTSVTSAQTAAACKGVVAMLFSNTAHYVTTGENPTAAISNGVLVPANVPIFIADIQFGNKLAAITV